MKRKPATLDQLADRFVKRHGHAREGTEGAYAAWGFVHGYWAAQRRKSRRHSMLVLDRVLAEGGYKLTVRAYNSILTGLGYRLTR